MGFLMNHFISSNGKNSFLNFSWYVSNAVIKHTLALESISFNLQYNSNPVYYAFYYLIAINRRCPA
jgi:hypothetical protein